MLPSNAPCLECKQHPINQVYQMTPGNGDWQTVGPVSLVLGKTSDQIPRMASTTLFPPYFALQKNRIQGCHQDYFPISA